MQEVSCYNCNSGVYSFYASENGFNLVKCNHCGLLYVNPRPTDEKIEQAHKFGLHRGDNTLFHTGKFQQNKVNNYIKILYDLFEDNSELINKKWLDIGCGNGEFLLALNIFGEGKILTKGLEPNIFKQESAQKRGLEVSFFDLNTHKEKYDFLSLLNVYSHLTNPPLSIQSWNHLLNPGGELLLETGDTANLSSEDHRKPFYLPDHLSFASEQIVVGILERTGFEVLKIKKYPIPIMNLIVIAKEFMKIFWPNKTSMFRNMLNTKWYAKIDMYILARLKV